MAIRNALAELHRESARVRRRFIRLPRDYHLIFRAEWTIVTRLNVRLVGDILSRRDRGQREESKNKSENRSLRSVRTDLHICDSSSLLRFQC